jgi:hypothetical protein
MQMRDFFYLTLAIIQFTMQKTLLFTIISISLLSCDKTYEFWPISKFNISEDALINDEQVTIIYYSRGPYDDEVDEGFYRHAVVVSDKTGDTINVLTFPNHDLDNLTENNRTVVYNNHPVLDKSITEKLLLSGTDISKATWDPLYQVARDPKFDHIADNDFPAIIGSLTKS